MPVRGEVRDVRRLFLPQRSSVRPSLLGFFEIDSMENVDRVRKQFLAPHEI